MDRLWAPWRMEYISGIKEQECFFCKYIEEDRDTERFILYRGQYSFVILNYYPYNNGHLMVAPYQHTASLSDLDQVVKLEMLNLVDKSCVIIREKMQAEGFNVGLNLGAVAGAGVKDHLHMHVVPRWTGDTNFLPVTGHTKVVSEGLRETWQKLRNNFKDLDL